MNLIINREKWIRGEGRSHLLGYDGRMCCLGFLSLACEFTPEQILRKSSIAGLAHVDESQIEPILNHPILQHLVIECHRPHGLMSSKLGFEMMAINDEEIPERIEERLTPLFSSFGVNVEFVG